MTVTASMLRELHRIHQQLTELRSRLDRGPRQITAGEANIAKLEAQLEEARHQLRRRRMSTDDKELQLKEREGRILDVRTKLNSCSSNREYQALVEQIAADEQANSVLSDEILELFDKITEDQEAAREAEQRLEISQQEWKKLRERVATERGSLENDIARLEKELQQAEDNLPGDVRADYVRIVKAHADDALAPVDAECCGGCFQRITPQMLNELALSRIVFCRNCGRILYLPEDTTVGG